MIQYLTLGVDLMCILINKNGHKFLEFIEITEDDLNAVSQDAPLTHSLIVLNTRVVFF
jgi:hypothetical protein